MTDLQIYLGRLASRVLTLGAGNTRLPLALWPGLLFALFPSSGGIAFNRNSSSRSSLATGFAVGGRLGCPLALQKHTHICESIS